jgi:BioD-like phosphotransacetylase family protein
MQMVKLNVANDVLMEAKRCFRSTKSDLSAEKQEAKDRQEQLDKRTVVLLSQIKDEWLFNLQDSEEHQTFREDAFNWSQR